MTKSLLLVFLATAVARPDIGLVYNNYKPPSTSYGVPEGPTIPSGSYIPSKPTANLNTPFFQNGAQAYPQVPLREYTSTNKQTDQGTGGYSQQGGFVSNSQGYNLNQQGYNQDQQAYSQNQQGYTQNQQGYSQNQQGYSQNQFGQQSYNDQQGFTQISKNVYFFTAPEDPEDHRPARVQIPQAPAKKNIKLIFIKAPTYDQQTRIVAQQPQIEEKTIVYVLVKKPEDIQDITIPTPMPLPPSKPEVYFIKYNTQKEAEEKITGTLHGAQQDAYPANMLNGERELLDTIKEKYGVGKLDDRMIDSNNNAFSGANQGSFASQNDNQQSQYGSGGVVSTQPNFETSNSAQGNTNIAQSTQSNSNSAQDNTFGGIFSTNYDNSAASQAGNNAATQNQGFTNQIPLLPPLLNDRNTQDNQASVNPSNNEISSGYPYSKPQGITLETTGVSGSNGASSVSNQQSVGDFVNQSIGGSSISSSQASGGSSVNPSANFDNSSGYVLPKPGDSQSNQNSGYPSSSVAVSGQSSVSQSQGYPDVPTTQPTISQPQGYQY